MRIIIVGAGLVGTQLAQHLIQEKHDVSLIESNEERARHASNRFDCMVLHDEGNSLASLEEAGIRKADALVCVTDSDEVNMIICGLAASRYPAVLKIARVRNDEYIKLNLSAGPAPKGEHGRDGRILGIDHFVHPDVEASRSVLNAIEHRAIGDVLAFADTPYGLGSIDIAAGSAFDGLALTDFRSTVTVESLVTMVEREGSAFLPTGATLLSKGDRVHILAKEKEIDSIFTLAGREGKPLRKIGIVGGGRIGVLVAEGLLKGEQEKRSFPMSLLKKLMPKKNRRIIIIEENYNRCKELAARFPDALILNEDISDESFVAEERIDGLDLIVTATENQELNMIAAVYLKSRGVRRAIATVTGSGYAAIARQLGVDVVIPMKSVVVDSILSHLMGGGVKAVHRIGGIGIMEIEIRSAAPVANTPLREFRLSAGGLVMLVYRGGGSFIPKGDYVFTPGDRIILIARNGGDPEIEKAFGTLL